jgi:hypothetical protein
MFVFPLLALFVLVSGALTPAVGGSGDGLAAVGSDVRGSDARCAICAAPSPRACTPALDELHPNESAAAAMMKRRLFTSSS